MNKNDKVRNVILIVLAMCLIGITVAYASLSQNLNISGISKVSKSEWNIHFTNLQTPKVEGYASGGKAVLNGESTVITISEGILKAPGDKIVYTFDVINEGDLPAEVELTTTQMESCRAEDNSDVTNYCDKIGIDLVYSETKEKVQKNDKLLVGETKTLNLIITYDKDKLLTSLPTSPITLSNITSIINYTMLAKEKGEITEQPVSNVICKRATTLHTEECTQANKLAYCKGAGYTVNGSKGTSTITYGNLGTTGVLQSGDAFDCDVNGDGEYNSSTERFYYVSDYYNTTTKTFESDTATLIYYNNVSNGEANNTSSGKIEYDSMHITDSSEQNWYGPVTAIKNLPTTSQWSNVNLTNEVRAILNENGGNTTTGGTLPSDFSYSGYATRLLTNQEINRSCGTTEITTKGYLDNCNYLMENTLFSNNSLTSGYWLENTVESSSTKAWGVNSISRIISNIPVSNTKGPGTRPVIEVSKTKIDY